MSDYCDGCAYAILCPGGYMDEFHCYESAETMNIIKLRELVDEVTEIFGLYDYDAQELRQVLNRRLAQEMDA